MHTCLCCCCCCCSGRCCCCCFDLFSTTLHQSESDCTPRRPSRPPTRPPLPLPRPRAALASWEFPPVCNASMSSCLGGWASTICPASRFVHWILKLDGLTSSYARCKLEKEHKRLPPERRRETQGSTRASANTPGGPPVVVNQKQQQQAQHRQTTTRHKNAQLQQNMACALGPENWVAWFAHHFSARTTKS